MKAWDKFKNYCMYFNSTGTEMRTWDKFKIECKSMYPSGYKSILGFNGVVLIVGVTVTVDNETSMMTSSILKICRLGLRRCS